MSATLMNEPTVPLMPMPGHLPNPGIQQVMGPNDAANAAAPAHDAAGTAMLGNLNSIVNLEPRFF